jgi:hypothetical protein
MNLIIKAYVLYHIHQFLRHSFALVRQSLTVLPIFNISSFLECLSRIICLRYKRFNVHNCYYICQVCMSICPMCKLEKCKTDLQGI